MEGRTESPQMLSVQQLYKIAKENPGIKITDARLPKELRTVVNNGSTPEGIIFRFEEGPDVKVWEDAIKRLGYYTISISIRTRAGDDPYLFVYPNRPDLKNEADFLGSVVPIGYIDFYAKNRQFQLFIRSEDEKDLVKLNFLHEYLKLVDGEYQKLATKN